MQLSPAIPLTVRSRKPLHLFCTAVICTAVNHRNQRPAASCSPSVADTLQRLAASHSSQRERHDQRQRPVPLSAPGRPQIATPAPLPQYPRRAYPSPLCVTRRPSDGGRCIPNCNTLTMAHRLPMLATTRWSCSRHRMGSWAKTPKKQLKSFAAPACSRELRASTGNLPHIACTTEPQAR